MGHCRCRLGAISLREGGTTYFYPYRTITKENEEDLQLVMFANLKTDFDELFDM